MEGGEEEEDPMTKGVGRSVDSDKEEMGETIPGVTLETQAFRICGEILRTKTLGGLNHSENENTWQGKTESCLTGKVNEERDTEKGKILEDVREASDFIGKIDTEFGEETGSGLIRRHTNRVSNEMETNYTADENTIENAIEVQEEISGSTERQQGIFNGKDDVVAKKLLNRTDSQMLLKEDGDTLTEVTSQQCHDVSSVSPTIRKSRGRKASGRNHGNHQHVQEKITGEGKDLFECDICFLTFTSKAFLHLHMYKLHKVLVKVINAVGEGGHLSNQERGELAGDRSPQMVKEDRSPQMVKEDRSPQMVKEDRSPQMVKEDRSPQMVKEDRSPQMVKEDRSPQMVKEDRSPQMVKEEENGKGELDSQEWEEDPTAGKDREKLKTHSFNLRKRKETVVKKRLRSVRRCGLLTLVCSTAQRENTVLCDVCYEKFHCGDQKHWHMQIHTGEEVLKCDGCLQVFSQTSVLYTHTSQTHANHSSDKNSSKTRVKCENKEVGTLCAKGSSSESKLVICDICGKAFGKKRDYQRHKRIHTGEKPYVCRECGKGFSDGGSFNKHKRIHTGEKPFHCAVCDKAFNRKWDVNRHMSVHTGAKPFPCYICGKSYSRKYEQEKHIKFHTGSAKDLPFICPICRRAYKVNSDLQKHIKTHSDDRPFQCSFCEKAFIIRRDLQRHVRSHTGEKPYICSVCGKGFRDTSAYAQHKKIHSGVKPFKCPHCSKGFVKKDDRKRHVRVHTGERPYVCSHCGKAFGKNHDLKRHTRMHTGERPYKCTVCSKAFMRSSNLHTHMNIHTGEKPYKCTTCPRAFKGSGDLYRHIKSHEKEKAHKCSMCQESFSRASDLDRHMESHFGKRQFYQGQEGLLPSSGIKNSVEPESRESGAIDFGDSLSKGQGVDIPPSFGFGDDRVTGNYSVESLPVIFSQFRESGLTQERKKPIIDFGIMDGSNPVVNSINSLSYNHRIGDNQPVGIVNSSCDTINSNNNNNSILRLGSSLSNNDRHMNLNFVGERGDFNMEDKLSTQCHDIGNRSVSLGFGSGSVCNDDGVKFINAGLVANPNELLDVFYNKSHEFGSGGGGFFDTGTVNRTSNIVHSDSQYG